MIASVAIAATLLSAVLPSVFGDPVVVTSYVGLVETVGADNEYDTGMRFTREAQILVHKEGVCEPDFATVGLAGFENFPEMYTLVSVDVDHAEKELLEKLGIDPAALLNPQLCPSMVIVKRRARVDNPAPNPVVPNEAGNLLWSMMKMQQVSLGVVNERDFDIELHYTWMNDPVKPTHIQRLEPGKENWMLTYKATTIIARNKATQEEVGRHLVTGNGLFTIATRGCTAETCGSSEGAAIPLGKNAILDRADVERQPIPSDQASVQARKNMDDSRLVNNQRQPVGLPQFTEVGFKKITVPDDVWDLIKSYYEENKNSPKKEVWSKHNVFTNNVEAPSYMVNLPENGKLKERIFEGLRPILEEWSGVKLVQTACYGIRVYTNTSWLANHVDTRTTHAVSVIMQVDQDVEEDWPLMIYDHAGNDYNITMKPRDLVLYESATCIHGRPSTLNGNYYANAFVHYKPRDPEEWAKYVS